MVKTAAVLFGVVFLLVGILGFVPAVTKDQMLLGIFHVNAAHNVVHLLSGAVALFAGIKRRSGAGLFPDLRRDLRSRRRNGIHDGRHLLGLISNNTADTWLHVGIAAVSLLLGFMPASSEPA